MARKKRSVIVWYREEGEDDTWLAYRNKEWKVDGKKATDATLEQLAEFCDQDAEDSNYHDFVGVHTALGELLLSHMDREAATAIVRDIAEQNGLHGLAGLS